jgi:hypothetical protein
MKATIDIPDELYRKVKARSALLGKRIRDVTIELYRKWLGEEAIPKGQEDPTVWLRGWLQLSDELTKNAPTGPSAREILEEDRNRLEPKR